MVTCINNKTGNVIAFLHHNILIDVTTKNVIGIVLGNCVYGERSYAVGKFFNHVFRDVEGKIIGVNDTEQKISIDINEQELVNGAWQLLMQINNHNCAWVPENLEWSETPLTDHL